MLLMHPRSMLLALPTLIRCKPRLVALLLPLTNTGLRSRQLLLPILSVLTLEKSAIQPRPVILTTKTRTATELPIKLMLLPSRTISALWTFPRIALRELPATSSSFQRTSILRTMSLAHFQQQSRTSASTTQPGHQARARSLLIKPPSLLRALICLR
jgi:hypothetical protein